MIGRVRRVPPAQQAPRLSTRKLVLIAAVILLAGCAGYETAAQLVQAPYAVPVRSGWIENRAIDESSGLAASRIDPDVLWTINDSGAPPLLFALGKNGEDLGTFRIKGAKNRDWEDIAAFRKEGIPYLLVADVGDNRGTWDHVTLYGVREPEIRRPAPDTPRSVPVAWVMRFQYEDGPRDTEAVGVDEGGDTILLISKRETPPALYTLPLTFGDESIQVAWRAGELTGFPRPTLMQQGTGPLFGGHGGMVTAMDVSPGGNTAMVLTYQQLYLFDHRTGESWAEAFRRQPETIPLPPLSQAEGACFAADGQTLFVSSEKRPAPLLQIRPQAVTAP